jgi:hypothetical protein
VSALLTSLVSTIHRLGDSASTRIPNLCSSLRTPIDLQTNGTSTPVGFDSFEGLLHNRYQKAKQLVADAWVECLVEDPRTKTPVGDNFTPFYELWGSPLAAYALKEF